MRAIIDPWGRKRWGDDVRVIHELQLGRRRADMLWVCRSDLILAEVKGPRDHLGDGRLPGQIAHFAFYVPEIWVFICPKWQDHEEVRKAEYEGANVATVFPDGKVVTKNPDLAFDRRKARRDDMCCSRLVERLWSGEVMAVAKRNHIPVEFAPGQYFPTDRVRGMIARMLTGQQIMLEVCRALRQRPEGMVGIGSDAAHAPL